MKIAGEPRGEIKIIFFAPYGALYRGGEVYIPAFRTARSPSHDSAPRGSGWGTPSPGSDIIFRSRERGTIGGEDSRTIYPQLLITLESVDNSTLMVLISWWQVRTG